MTIIVSEEMFKCPTSDSLDNHVMIPPGLSAGHRSIISARLAGSVRNCGETDRTVLRDLRLVNSQADIRVFLCPLPDVDLSVFDVVVK